MSWWNHCVLSSGSKKSRWSKSSSGAVHNHPGADSAATSSSVQRADSLNDSDAGVDHRTCLRVAIIVTPIIGVCVLIPIVVVALRLLSGSERRRAGRPLVVVPSLRSADTEKPDSTDLCPFCGDPVSLCLCRSGSRTKFVVLTAAQSRRSPGGGYQQMVQPPTTTVYPCRCCGQNAYPVHDATDRTPCQLDADVDGDFV